MWLEGRAALVLVAALAVSSIGHAQSRLPSVDRFTATTASMTPADIGLRIDVREWSDEGARAAVVAALAEPDAPKALADLPTVGYVWQSNSGVGYAVKYAHRAATSQGERITFVTDKRVGSYEFKPWVADTGAASSELGYSVIELYLQDGMGDGTMSLAAGVQIDRENGVVALEAEGAPRVLANAKLEPKPYWASGT